MTLEAWLYPQALSAWRTVMLKEQPGGLTYSIYIDNTSRAAGWVHVNGEAGATAPSALALNTWTHVAVTYNGSALRLFINGAQVASQNLTGAMVTSTGALRIGGNSVWGEYFKGRIDEVRIYNRALTQAEVGADMNTAVTP